MAHSGSGGDVRSSPERGFHPGRVASAGHRLGWALVGAALPAALASVLVAVVGGPVDGGILSWFETAMETSVVHGTGLPWAFHVSVLTALVGVWLLGFALVVEGYFDVGR